MAVRHRALLGLALGLASSGLVNHCSAVEAGSGKENARRYQVADAVKRGLLLHEPTAEIAGRLQLLTDVTSVSEKTRLRVAGVKAAPGGRGQLLRMECPTRGSCLPFYALLPPANDATRGDAPGSPPLERWRSGKGAAFAAQAIRSDLVVHPGELVLMTEERSGMHLLGHAISLEAGALGATIRVRNTMSRVVLQVVVAGKNSVRVE